MAHHVPHTRCLREKDQEDSSAQQIPDLKKLSLGASLVAQWLRISLPMQGTRVRALVREDPTCHGATEPLHHNY